MNDVRWLWKLLIAPTFNNKIMIMIFVIGMIKRLKNSADDTRG